MFVGLQAKLYAIGAGVLGLLALILRMQSLKNGRDRARQERDVLKARHHVQKTQKKIKRKEEERLVSHKADIVNQIKKEKEEFEGISSLEDSNDF